MNTKHLKLALGIVTGIIVGVIAKDTTVENLDAMEDKIKSKFLKKSEEQK